MSEILNRDARNDLITEEEVEELEDIDTGRWCISEVKSALKRTRRCEAAGVDQVGPELLKSAFEITASRLVDLYNKIWETERETYCVNSVDRFVYFFYSVFLAVT